MDAVLAESPAETPQISAQSTISAGASAALPSHGTPFSAQNAREMALRSHAKRKKRQEELRKALDSAQQPPQEDSEYRLFRLKRTREQLLSLDRDLEACSDEKGKKAIVDAIKALCDVEQKLALRPLPGSRRPGRETPAKRSGEVGPVE